MLILFEVLGKKIRLLIFCTIAIYISLVSSVNYIILNSNLYNNEVSLNYDLLSRQHIHSELYFKYIEETSNLILKNQSIVDFLSSSGDISEAKKVINGTISSSLSITGISLYGIGNSVCVSDSLTNILHAVPSLWQILNSDSSLNNFSKSSDLNTCIIRHSDMLKVYNFIKPLDRSSDYIDYTSNSGILTFISKIYGENNNFLGYLIIDSSASAFCNFFREDDSSSNNPGNQMYLLSKNKLLPSTYNEVPSENISAFILKNRLTKEKYIITDDKRNMVVYNKLYNSDDSYVIVLPQTPFMFKLLGFQNKFIILILCFFAISIYVCYLQGKSVSSPLTILYDKMQSFKI